MNANYQVNVGPTGEGIVQPAGIRRLRESPALTPAPVGGVQLTRPGGLPDDNILVNGMERWRTNAKGNKDR